MKKIILITLISVLAKFTILAQNSEAKMDDRGRIAIAAIVPEQVTDVPESAKQRLLTLMTQMVTRNGLGAAGSEHQFCIVPKVNLISKEITPTAPPMQVVNLEVVFFIVDASSQQIFSQISVDMKGVGQNETKAYMQAIQAIKPNAGQFKGFIEKGKTKIIEYYNSNCDEIIQRANAYAKLENYEAALYTLLTVPNVSRECSDKCMKLSGEIYESSKDKICDKNLAAAKAAYANMDIDKAAKHLSTITPDMNCYPQAEELVNEITQKMKDDGANIWDFKMKKYDDTIEKEKMMIRAVNDIANHWAYWGAAKYFNWDWKWLYQ